MAQIPDEAVHLLEGRHFAHVATVMADGTPQVTPVWIDHEGDTVSFNTAAGRFKEKNLRRDPNVTASARKASRSARNASGTNHHARCTTSTYCARPGDPLRKESPPSIGKNMSRNIECPQ